MIKKHIRRKNFKAIESQNTVPDGKDYNTKQDE